ncbi:MAG: type II toxin-antitoxin system PemK/MazF family toxin [Treponema sp.]|nr:type II toxin-antitoxin system PemK/MazF family toxin [Treponema sp.]
MKRGDLYRVYKGNKNDQKDYRVYLVVSRQDVIDNQFPTVICAPILTKYGGLSTQVEVGVDEGMKHDCAVYCDDLFSLPKFILTNYISNLSNTKMEEVNSALRTALAV